MLPGCASAIGSEDSDDLQENAVLANRERELFEVGDDLRESVQPWKRVGVKVAEVASQALTRLAGGRQRRQRLRLEGAALLHRGVPLLLRLGRRRALGSQCLAAGRPGRQQDPRQSRPSHDTDVFHDP